MGSSRNLVMTSIQEKEVQKKVSREIDWGRKHLKWGRWGYVGCLFSHFAVSRVCSQLVYCYVLYIYTIIYLQHEDYNDGSGSYANDISVLYMASSADTGHSDIATIDICRASDGDWADTLCVISGWGTTES